MSEVERNGAAGQGEMTTPLLRTKIHSPPARPERVSRSRLIEQLNAGSHRKLTRVSAAAGLGRITWLSEWVDGLGGAIPPIATAELSLDGGDNDSTRFLARLIAALRKLVLPAQSPVEEVRAMIVKEPLSALRSSRRPPAEEIRTALINEISAILGRMILVLDDCHLIEAEVVHDALALPLEHLPPYCRVGLGSQRTRCHHWGSRRGECLARQRRSA